MDGKPRVAVVGVTGFIGSGLARELAGAGFSVTGVSRSGDGSVPGVETWQSLERMDFSGHRAVINLAGESVAQRWTESSKNRMIESRVNLTSRVVESLARTPEDLRPKSLVNASAVGIYGDRGDEILTESSAAGNGFLAELCLAWEAAANGAKHIGVRVACPRIGIVLGNGGEATERLLRVFRLGLGGRLGNGRQWMPWIHVDDLRNALVRLAVDDTLVGPINCVAPHPVRNIDFTRLLGEALHRPARLPVPGFALKLGLGGFGAALLGGQNIRPSVLEHTGFHYRFPDIKSALADLTGAP